MRVVLKQIFPLARFHATPWRVNPFDDPYGEWPPSPWRLVRAVAARWYQWWREDPQRAEGRLEPLIQALCQSSYSFHLPAHTRRGAPLRQYFPVEFGWTPKEKKKAAVRSYSTSLAQDNYMCLPPGDYGALWWFLEGDRWDHDLSLALNECLRRMTYFGRAESFTRIALASDAGEVPEPNCTLMAQWIAGTVPVLVPESNASRKDVERITDDPEAVQRSIPPGARLMYATQPPRMMVREMRNPRKSYAQTHLIQFAIGWNVAPAARAIVRLTAKFRGAAIKEMLRLLTGDPRMTWSIADYDVRKKIEEMAGKDPLGKPLEGHRHTEYLVWCEDGELVRLLAWRNGRPFDACEQEAMLRAAEKPLSWAASVEAADVWKVRLVPLDRAVPRPPGFDGVRALDWESVTPYVPPRHHLRGGKLRSAESIELQVRRELALRQVPGAEEVVVQTMSRPEWVAVHLPRAQRRKTSFIGDRRGYRLRLRFPYPVEGPIRLGHSSSFGLGLFRPVV